MKKPIFFLLLGLGVLLLVGGIVVFVPIFKNMYAEMGEIIDKQTEYRRELRNYAFQPLTEEQDILLAQIEENPSTQESNSLDVILSTEEYLTYINNKYNSEYTDYLSYIHSMPDTNHRMVLLERLNTILDTEVREDEENIWVDFYYTIRNWSKSGKNQLNSRKEFQDLLTKELVDPLMKYTKSGFSVKTVQMGMISAMMIDDTEIFHKAWQSRMRTFGEHKGILYAAIATPDEFALMRSFFEDDVSFRQWIVDPFEIKEPE
ncbi:hypothetical protein C6497_04825 [Candidatus Poribacteria bacterium]|nr:MAG: hypothetical protein C6497_04825 [Candidatus Poribacteria bacterium]